MEHVRYAECDASPEDVAYDAKCLDLLNSHMQSLIDEGRIRSGSYCLWRHGKVFADAAMGSIACEWMGNTEFKPDTLFEIQSVGKVITAIAVLTLLDDGLLYLDQPVAELIKEFDTGDFKKITIKHLLTHTSGLCALDGSYPQDERRWWEYMDPADPANSWLSALVKTGLHAAPGEKWIYSTAAYLLLGEVIKRLSGIDAERYIYDKILKPCEMRDTHWRKDATRDQLKRYNIANETDIAMAKRYDSLGERALAAPTYQTWPGIPDTAGGEMSTCREMMHLAEMILRDGMYRGRRVIGKKALSLLWTDMLPPDIRAVSYGMDSGIRYGAGMCIYSSDYDKEQVLSEGTIYHEGAGTSVFLVDRQEDFAAMFQTSFCKEFDWDARAVKEVATIIHSGIK